MEEKYIWEGREGGEKGAVNGKGFSGGLETGKGWREGRGMYVSAAAAAALLTRKEGSRSLTFPSFLRLLLFL